MLRRDTHSANWAMSLVYAATVLGDERVND
jgi:hypothetical protein